MGGKEGKEKEEQEEEKEEKKKKKMKKVVLSISVDCWSQSDVRLLPSDAGALDLMEWKLQQQQFHFQGREKLPLQVMLVLPADAREDI